MDGVSIESLIWLISGVVGTVDTDFEIFDDSDSVICANHNITVVKVEDTDNFNFENVIMAMRTKLTQNPGFKIILVGGSVLLDTRITPVLNRKCLKFLKE